MARCDEIGLRIARVNRDRNSVGAVIRRYTRRHPFARLDRHGEGGAMTRAVILRHLLELKNACAFGGSGEADQTTSVGRHLVDAVRGCELSKIGRASCRESVFQSV